MCWRPIAAVEHDGGRRALTVDAARETVEYDMTKDSGLVCLECWTEFDMPTSVRVDHAGR